jgi:hypothetical protein
MGAKQFGFVESQTKLTKNSRKPSQKNGHKEFFREIEGVIKVLNAKH